MWGIARQVGRDPTRWQLKNDELETWGGEALNELLAALLVRTVPGKKFKASGLAVTGPFSGVEFSVEALRAWTHQAEEAGDLSLDFAGKFTNRSRFAGELSSVLAAEEKRRSIPWKTFHRWLDRVARIDVLGPQPTIAI